MDTRIKYKNFVKENLITLIFVSMIIISLIATDQDGVFIIDSLLNKVIGLTLITIALILPIKLGMGFNFSIGVGAMAAQFGIIIAVSLELSGFLGVILTVIIATLLALIFGYFVGLLLNKARGHEMISSLFISYAANGFYQFVFLFLFGGIIPIKASELVLSSGTGLRNTIDLKSTLFKPFDGVLELPVFVLLIVASITSIIFFVIKLRKDKSIMTIASISLSSLCLIISGLIMFSSWLPNNITRLKTIKLPIISVIIILTIILCYKYLIRDRISHAIIEVNNGHGASKKMRITAIVISTVLAAWGQIIYLQNIGIVNTYGSHRSISLYAISALIIGGATLKHATIKHAVLGLILSQTFYIVSLPLIDGNLSSIVQTIIMNCVYIYVFTKKYADSNQLALNN